MGRIAADEPIELLSGEHANVAAYGGRGSEAAGSHVALASRNEFPSPDLARLTRNGRLPVWFLRCPPRPNEWNVYMRQLNLIGEGGVTIPLRDTQMLRQNLSPLGYNRPFYEQKHELYAGPTLPNADKRAAISRPDEPPRVRVVQSDQAEGFAAGRRWVSYAGIVGNPATSHLITTAAPPAQVDLLQGQRLRMFTPDEIPASWDGIAFLVSPVGGRVDELMVQERMNIRFITRDSIVLDGPFRERKVTFAPVGSPTAVNRTYRSGYLSSPAPKRLFWRSKMNLQPMTTQISYRWTTPYGVGASQNARQVSIGTVKPGEALVWTPPKAPAGVTGWIPEFLGNDGEWYTLQTMKNGVPLNRAAAIHSTDPKAEVWKKQCDAAVKLPRNTIDRSGVEGISAEAEPPEPLGVERLAPGSYAVRLTKARDDEETAPSDPTTATLRDSGLAAGLAATGVSDQIIRVFRPQAQNIANARFIEVDPRTGLPDIEWTAYNPPSVTITPGKGFLEVDDLSNSAEFVNVRATGFIEQPEGRVWTLRVVNDMLRYTGGRHSVWVTFHDVDKNQLGGAEVYRHASMGRERFIRRIGPADRNCDAESPAGTRYIVLHWRNYGVASARNLHWRASQIGLFIGNIVKRKRHPLDLGLSAPEELDSPIADAEDEAEPYPPGSYIRVIENPDDGATYANPNRLAMENFEDGAFDSSWTEYTTGDIEALVREEFALQGDYGLRLRRTPGTTGVASWRRYRSFYDPQNPERPTLAASLWFKPQNLYAGGTGNLLWITQSDNPDDWLTRIGQNAANRLILQSRNGATELTTTLTQEVYPNDTIRLEIVTSGAGTLNGTVEVHWVRNGRREPLFTQTSLDWTGRHPYGVGYGVSTAESGGDAFRYLIDRIGVTVDGETSSTPVPGNLVEYFSDAQTPKDPEYFMTGAMLPVEPNTDYVDSVFVATHGADPGTALFKLVIRNARGQIIQELPHIARGLGGDNFWHRPHLHYRTPPGAAYVEYNSNNVGGGLIRAMGFQHERGTAPTAFTNENLPEGYMRWRMSLMTPGGGPMADTDLTERWLRVASAITHTGDPDSADFTTYHELLWRTADTLEGLAAAGWRASVDDMTLEEMRRPIAEFYLRLFTNDLTESPEVRGVFLDLQRAVNTLTRADGSEFHRGAIAYDIQPLASPSRYREIAYADGGIGFEDYSRGLENEVLELSIQCFDRETATEIQNTVGREDVDLVFDQRYSIRLTGDDVRLEGDTEDSTKEGYWDYVVEGVRAVVREREAL